MTKRAITRFALAPVLLVLLAPILARQEATGSLQASESVPISEITGRLQETRLAVREARNELAGEMLPQGRQSLDQARLEIERLRSPAYEILPAVATAEELSNRVAEWRLVERTLVDLEDRLGTRIEEINALIVDLREREALWQATAARAQLDELPEDVTERLTQLLQSVSELTEALRRRRGELLTLQAHADDQLVECREDLNLTLAAAEDTRRRRFTIDSPPLWEALWSGETDEQLAEQAADALRRDWQALADFVVRARGRLIAQLLTFVFLTLVLARLGRAIRLGGEEDALRLVALILERPGSAALLVTFLTGVVVYPNAPAAYSDLVRLLLVVTLVRILPRIVLPDLRPFVLWFAAIYVLDNLSGVAGRGTVLERLILLGVAVAGLLLMGRLRRVVPSAAERMWKGPLKPLFFVGAAVFTVAAAANAIGAVTLSAWLLRATLTSLYAGLLLRILYLILAGLAFAGLRSQWARRARIVQTHAGVLNARLRQIFVLAVVVFWILLSLNYFGSLEPLQAATLAALGFSFEVGSLTISIGNLAALVLVVCLSFIISAFVRFVLNEQVLPGMGLHRGVRAATSQLTHYTILFVGFLLAVRAGGIDLTSFAVLAGAFGVGIGFGLQGVVNNFVSGIILLFERPIHVGDRIQVGEHFGDVKRIGIRASVVRTFDGAEVIVPNGTLLSTEVINWTLSDQVRRANISIGVAYGTDPERVLALLARVADENSTVLGHPPPESFFVGHGDSSLDFELRVWLRSDDYFRTRSDLTVAVNQALQAAGIEIPFPQRDLHVRSVDGAAIPSREAATRSQSMSEIDEPEA